MLQNAPEAPEAAPVAENYMEPAAPGPVPTIGRIVHYRLSQSDVERIGERRRSMNRLMPPAQREINPGFMARGNIVVEGTVVAMIIVAVWGDQPDSAVNGRCLLDGTDDHWATSVYAGEGPGTWSWPARS